MDEEKYIIDSMKASDYIISFIASQGTDTFFSVSGGMITHLEDSIFLNKSTRLISMKHEQAGAFAAEGYARSTGNTGVALATSGPGATNLITGVASAYFDSVPVLYITGQVNTTEITPNTAGVRQTGFQETDIVSMILPVTKYASQILDISMLRYELEKAFFIMHHERKGPVLLDIPMNIQRTDITPQDLLSYFDSDEYKLLTKKETILDQKIIGDITGLLMNAQRPLILAGGGIQSSGSVGIFRDFLQKSGIPVVASLMGVDSVGGFADQYVGMIGSYGVRHANIVLNQADILLVIGSRLDIRQTGARRAEFAPNAVIIHVDIDSHELGYNLPQTHIQVKSDISSFLHILLQEEYGQYEKWKFQIGEVSKILPVFSTEDKSDYVQPNSFISQLDRISTPDTVYVSDVGQNQMWTAQSIKLQEKQRLLNCGGLGSMGFSLPTAVGVAFDSKVDRVISINGDGGFQMNIQELETITYHKLPIGIIVMNNRSLGMVREFQDTYFEGRNIGTVAGYSCPNLEKIADAYGIPFFQIQQGSDIESVFPKILEIKGSYMLEVLISPKSTVEPKILFGNAIDNQSPILSDEMKKKISNIFQ